MEKCLDYLEQNQKDRPLLMIMSAYQLINQALAQKGYKEGKDYFDINVLLMCDSVLGRDLLKNT